MLAIYLFNQSDDVYHGHRKHMSVSGHRDLLVISETWKSKVGSTTAQCLFMDGGLLGRGPAPEKLLHFVAYKKTRFDSSCRGPERPIYFTAERKTKRFPVTLW